jgi:hydroxymethylbilane synthase
MRLRLATRSSAQAMAQSEIVAAQLVAAHDGLTVELVQVDTLGDQLIDIPLHTIGGQGVFVKEVQRAVLAGAADLAVHSAKDLPSEPTEGLVIAAFTVRRSAADCLVGRALDELPEGGTVATGSVRRRAQLVAQRPDLHFVELRGNIITRLTKVPDGGSLVMAVAALEILGLTERIAAELPVDVFVPAPGQGCVAIECRSDDDATASLLAALDDAPARGAVERERRFLAELGSGCSLPVGAYCDDVTLTGFLADPASGRHLTRSIDADGDIAALVASMRADLG